MKNALFLLVFLLLFFWSVTAQAELTRSFGTVRDAITGQPLTAVEVATSEGFVTTDQDGCFTLTTDDQFLIIRMPGYRPQRVANDFPLNIVLQPFVPKALYLSYWAAGSRDLRDHLIGLVEETGMNALVIDLKSSRGDIAFKSRLPLAREIGAQKARTLKDLPQFLNALKQRGIYTIGRIVVFKDDALAKSRRKLAVLTPEGYLWEDREKISWVDPFNREVWNYNIGLAEEAARIGFDEIQFDYIRFPANSDLVFSSENTGENRVAAISGFLHQARQKLSPYPVLTSANIFGYICWKHKDQKIGQRLIDLAQHVDYLSPMLYPSSFPHGIPGYANPVANVYEVIAHSLKRAGELSGLPAVRFRPWLQAFRDYAFDHRRFSADDIHAQINASVAAGSHGWMLWNAASRFNLAGLQQNIPYGELNLTDAVPKGDDTAILSRLEEDSELYPSL
ncbi:MAG: hypothetical protein JXQ81_08475 [Desulfuromonadales bacterium]|nr:hypothetical protein [Desulfuromonadales bacterium]MBN2792524.1 hypothetical protein [Desulfuromonadales bacterium]